MLFELRQSLISLLNAIRNTKQLQPSLKSSQPINVGTEIRHPVLRDRYKSSTHKTVNLVPVVRLESILNE